MLARSKASVMFCWRSWFEDMAVTVAGTFCRSSWTRLAVTTTSAIDVSGELEAVVSGGADSAVTWAVTSAGARRADRPTVAQRTVIRVERQDGLEAFARGNATHIICMKGEELWQVMNHKLDLAEVLTRKTRRAAETGEAFVEIRALYPI